MQRLMAVVAALLLCFTTLHAYSLGRSLTMVSKTDAAKLMNGFKRTVAAVTISAGLLASGLQASTAEDNVKEQPLYTKVTSDLQKYSDVGRGFKMLRPFGFNEFDGAGSGYAVKFASLFDVDENVVVGSIPATAGKSTIADYGDIKELGEKFAKKRDGSLVAAEAHRTEGIMYYLFQFETPLDANLPRTGPKNDRPTKGVELYQLGVSRGRLWSVKATSNDKLLTPAKEKTLRNSVASFVPRL